MNALGSLKADRVEIEEIALRQPNLDEVFLALTGQPQEERQAQMPPAHAA
jgi:hypothetical protein